MKLIDILKGFFWVCLMGETDVDILGISDDSRKVNKGDVFVCICGSQTDGHKYIKEAIDRGATAVIVSRPDVFYKLSNVRKKQKYLHGEPTWIQVIDTRIALADMAAAFYDYPFKKMKMIGITGTKGKTTTTYMIRQILKEAGYQTGMIGTIEIDNGVEKMPSDRTTPSALIIQKSLNEMVKNNVDVAIMEVSSQGLKHHRTENIIFDIGILTNISQDHIGKFEHENMEEYMHCKSLIFKQCKQALVNADCPLAVRAADGAGCEIIFYSLSHLQKNEAGDYLLNDENQRNRILSTNMMGDFNLENALAATLCGKTLSIDSEIIESALSHVQVKGRMEIIPYFKDFTVMIDYAHNAMALENLLKELRKNYTGKILCMFGCGGNRDHKRRYDMGKVSGKLADMTVITSDNPRYEKPEDIIEDICKGVCDTNGKYQIIADRKMAMRYSIQWAKKGDLVVFAGKGHEQFQEINGQKIEFDERKIICEILEDTFSI